MADQIQIVDRPEAQDISNDNEALFRFKSVFPLELFPDEVVLDKLKISIIKRDFILTKRIITLPMNSNINVKVFKGPITSQIQIDDTSTLHQGPVTIRNVWIEDAMRFHQIAEGMVIGMQKGINLMTMSKDEILTHVSEWGVVDTGGL